MRWLPAVATAAVLAAIVAGLVAGGPPLRERLRKLDQFRVTDLQNISGMVDRYYSNQGRLPGTLDSLAWALGPDAPPTLRDPESRRPYEYAVQDSVTYRVCAVFAEAAGDTARVLEEGVRPWFGPRENRYWLHAAGRVCFTLHPNRLPPGPR